MTVREGNLEAPTRHPLEWRSAEFYDEGKLFGELERVFEICHGCRRCISLCTAFPTLFDLIDEGKLKIRIGGRYPLEHARQAHEDLEARRTTGKLLLIP